MKINTSSDHFLIKKSDFKDLFNIMKICLFLLFAFAFQLMATNTNAQDAIIELRSNSVTVSQLISEIEKQTDYLVVYSNREVNTSRTVSLKNKSGKVSEYLAQTFRGTDIGYDFENKYIVLSKKAQQTASTITNLVQTLQQQGKTVRGTVTDSNGEPVIGATIVVQGDATKGTVTDIDGNFILSNLPENAVLQITYVGMKPQEVSTAGRSTIDVVMDVDVELLDEVVVVGYGTQRKSDVSGSVTTVSGDKLAKIPTANAETALQGMAPGLSVNFGSGAAGSAATLQVRGVTTWGTDNSPLVIIDGVPGDMSYLNPEDIKTMSVLKDAATAAIYGARAAAGVILIETHRGVMQSPKIHFSSYWGIDDLPKRMEVCNSAEFVKIRKMALGNAGIAQNRWPKYISEYEKDPSQFADTDWQKEYYRRGLTQKYNVGYTSGNSTTNVAFSAFYANTDAIVIGTGEKKYGFRLNSDMERGKFKVGESVSYSRWEADLEANSGFPSMYQVTNIEPLAFVYDENNDGGYGGAIAGMGMSDATNIVGFNNLVDYTSANDYIAASGYFQYEPIKNLIFKFTASRSIYFGNTRQFTPTYQLGVMKVNSRASLSEEREKTMNDLLEFTANWNKTFKEVHNIQTLFGLSQEENTYNNIAASGKKFENNEMDLLGHAQEDFTVGGTKTRSGLRSVFGRLNYNYQLKYMIMASLRYDGSSRFASGNKWGVFPSMSAGWNIANEEFWENMKNTVSTFKLRLSYGGLGNQSIGLYKYIPALTSNTNTLNYPFGGKDVSLGYAITQLPSSNIKWETTIYKNIGVDFGFLNNKLELSAEAYIKDTYDMLSTKNISLATGFGPLTVNDGKLRTTGYEIQAIYHGNANKFKYDLDVNLTHYRSILKAMADPNYLYEYGALRTYVGGEIGEFWVTKTDGIFQNEQEVINWNKEHGYYSKDGIWQGMQPSAKPGDIRFIDQNGDGQLDSSDKVNIGSGTPKIAAAFNVNLTYNNFDLTANFYGHFGVKRYNYTKFQLQRMDHVFNYGKDALNAWTPENTNTDIPRAVQGDPNKNTRVSDRFVENGDYLRLNNVQIGYNLPAKTCKNLNISNLRFYIGASRLFTLTNYKGYDPSTGSNVGQIGYDYAATPLSRTYMVGVKFGF